MGIFLYVLLSIIILYFIIKLDLKYGSIVGIKSFVLLFLRIVLSFFYFNVLNPNSKLYFLSDIFGLRDYPEYLSYLMYFTIVILLIYLLFPERLIKKYLDNKKKNEWGDINPYD